MHSGGDPFEVAEHLARFRHFFRHHGARNVCASSYNSKAQLLLMMQKSQQPKSPPPSLYFVFMRGKSARGFGGSCREFEKRDAKDNDVSVIIL
jgi:hypothetical protein